ncbi:unnamed protein product [Adineta steineri]|uniref:Uncharacterized protein n=1 Tax=Adineta steineri TaxID=433720 RepID=A0A815QDK4_9BILA|nr:unnamed protein product [Adineta steineri]
MNQSLSDFDLSRKYAICRQQSQCYLLTPPPSLPIFPQLILNNLSSTFENLPKNTDLCFILGIFIGLITTFLLLVLLIFKYGFYQKLRQDNHQIKTIDNTIQSTSFSNILPVPYYSLTPLTMMTNRSPSLTLANKLTLDKHLNSDSQSIYHNHSINIYDKIRLSTNHQHCSCCSCALAYYQQQQRQHIPTSEQVLPCYYTSISSPSEIICQNTSLERLHCQQQCFCHNFFVPIK